MKSLDPALALPGRHGAAQVISLARSEAGRNHGDLHHLLLKNRHAQGAAQRGVQVRMLQRDLPAAAHNLAVFQIRVHHAALNRPGPHDGHFHHQVVITARLQARQHGHLRPAFDLEHAHRVGFANHVEGLRVLFRNGVQLDRREQGGLAASPLVDQFHAAPNRRQHAQRQHIDLEQAHGVQVVLVPLDDAAVFHAGGLNRHQPRELALREHKATHVLAQMARKGRPVFAAATVLVGIRQFIGRVGVIRQQQLRDFQPLQHGPRLVLQARFRQLLPQHAAAVKPEMVGGQLLDQRRLNAQGLAHVAHGAAGAVADDGGGNGGAVVAVCFIDVLNDLLAPLVLEVHVNVGRLAALPADETLEQQLAFFGVYGGDAQAKTHGRIGRRAASLAQNFLLVGKAHDVVDGDEVHLVLQLDDQIQLMRQLGADFVGHAAGVAPGRALGCQPPKALAGRFRRGSQFAQRVAVQVANLIEVKAAARGHRERGRQQLGRVNAGQPHAGPQVRFGVGLQRKAAFMHGAVHANGSQHIVQRLAGAHMHQHTASGHQRHVASSAHLLQLMQAQRVVQALQQLDHQP